jgi:two-component system chemotaxis response regulator CheY
MDSMNILVVDDSPIIIRKLTMMIELLGYKVVKTAATGKEAIAAYRAFRPDMVTMDITMPEMDGIEATRRIIGEFPDAKIVMVTSHGQEKMVIDALKAGAKGYVLKPFDGHKVYEAIQKACKRVVLKDKLQSEIVHRAVEVPETESAAKVSGE